MSTTSSQLFDVLRAQLDGGFPAARIGVFRIALGIALLWKFTADHLQDGWHRLKRGGFARTYLQTSHPRVAAMMPAHPLIYTARFPAAIAVIAGYHAWTGLAVCTAWLMFELCYDFRYHTVYLMLCTATLMLAGTGIDGLPPSSASSTQRPGTRWSADMIVLITSQMYLSSAYLKLRSPQFRSGLLLSQFFAFSADVDGLLPYPEFLGPTALRRALGAPRLLPAWSAVSKTVILIEALLPAMLLLSGTSPVFALCTLACACVLHLGFTALLPYRLPPFTLATLAALLLFPAGAAVL